MKSWQDRTIRSRFCGVQPNKRLKPAGGALMESERLCADAHELAFNYKAPGGRVARSLSAIR